MALINTFPFACTVIQLFLSDGHQSTAWSLQRPFSGFHEIQTKRDGLGVCHYPTLQNLKPPVTAEGTWEIWVVGAGICIKKSHTNKMASLLIYCSLKRLERMRTPNIFPSVNTSITLQCLLFQSSLNIYECTQAYGGKWDPPHSTDQAVLPTACTSICSWAGSWITFLCMED